MCKSLDAWENSPSYRPDPLSLKPEHHVPGIRAQAHSPSQGLRREPSKPRLCPVTEKHHSKNKPMASCPFVSNRYPRLHIIRADPCSRSKPSDERSHTRPWACMLRNLTASHRASLDFQAGFARGAQSPLIRPALHMSTPIQAIAMQSAYPRAGVAKRTA